MNETKTEKGMGKNRVSLSDECYERLQNWEEQITGRCKGMRIKLSDLVEWCLLSRPEQLMGNELVDLQDKYLDDVSLATWALRELKKARSAGENVSLEQVLGFEKAPAKRSAQSRRKTDAEKLSGQLQAEAASNRESD